MACGVCAFLDLKKSYIPFLSTDSVNVKSAGYNKELSQIVTKLPRSANTEVDLFIGSEKNLHDLFQYQISHVQLQ